MRSPADDLLARLQQPETAAALNTLLDHADLLAIAVVALDGFLSRGDVIADTLAEAVGEIRSAGGGVNPLAGIDVKAIATTVANLSGPIVAAAPALTTLLEQTSRPQTVALVSQLTSAVAEVQDSHPTTPPRVGVVSLLRSLKDPDVARGADFVLRLAKAFGRQRS